MKKKKNLEDPPTTFYIFERRNEWIIISNYQLQIMVKINVALVYMVNQGMCMDITKLTHWVCFEAHK
jgi:hypothetical protein